MKYDLLEGDLELFATELVDNAGCRELVWPLNEFENLIFGPDFQCDAAQIKPWVESGCLFYSAVTGEAVTGNRRILSALSVFITNAASRDRMLLGEIADYEMAPWTQSEGGQPTIYLSSVVSVAPHHLAAMYHSLVRDVIQFREANGLKFHGGFAIATGATGRRHMARSGFRVLEGYKYRGIYDLMVVDAHTAMTSFWFDLLHEDTVFLRRADPTRAVTASTLVVEESSQPREGGARELEKRLALSKIQRLGGRRPF